MKTLFKVLGCLLVLPVLLAGCGGGGSGGGSTSGGTTTTPAGALSTTGPGANLTQTVGGVAAIFTNAVDINDRNEVIGFAEFTQGAPVSAALWEVVVNANDSAAITARELNPIGGNFSATFALDDVNGIAVGQSSTATAGELVAVFWPEGSSDASPLPELPSGGNSKALAISADGSLVVGEAQDATMTTRAVIWVSDGAGGYLAPIPLPVNTFASGADLSQFSAANGVARVGANEILVVGEAVAGDGTLHAALWRSTNNGATYTPSSLGVDHIAYAVNGDRLVVGESDTALSPVSWTVDASGAAAAPVSLAAAGSAVAVNENERIAGWAGATPSLATVWNGTDSASLFTAESQAFGLNNELEPLVVGRQGGTAFIKRVN